MRPHTAVARGRRLVWISSALRVHLVRVRDGERRWAYPRALPVVSSARQRSNHRFIEFFVLSEAGKPQLVMFADGKSGDLPIAQRGGEVLGGAADGEDAPGVRGDGVLDELVEAGVIGEGNVVAGGPAREDREAVVAEVQPLDPCGRRKDDDLAFAAEILQGDALLDVHLAGAQRRGVQPQRAAA